jgi:hypothetical protein
MIELINNWLDSLAKSGKIHHPSRRGVYVTHHMDLHSKCVTVKVTARMPFWYLRQKMCGIKSDFFENEHF